MKLRVRQLLMLLVSLLIIIVTITLASLSYSIIEQNAEQLVQSTRDNYDQNIRESAEIAVSMLKSIYSTYVAGEISEADMLNHAKIAVTSMRYDNGNGYFWIDDEAGVCVAHPVAANVGQERYYFTDANGVYYIQGLLRSGDAGGGYSEFSFPRIDSGDVAYAKRAYTIKFEPLGWYISTGAYMEDIMADANNVIADTKANLSLLVICALLLLVLFPCIVWLLSGLIDKPMKYVVAQMRRFASGDMEITPEMANMRTLSMDFAAIKQSVHVLSDSLKSLTNDLNVMAQLHEEGDSSHYIEEQKYEGAFHEVSGSINRMARAYLEDTKEVLLGLHEIATGNFNAEIRRFPGERAQANVIVDDMRANLQNIMLQTNMLIADAYNGNLTKLADTSALSGDWKDMVEGLNGLMIVFRKPIEDVMNMLKAMSGGDFSARIDTLYGGIYNQIKNAANTTVTEISSYIMEISALLNEMAVNHNYQITIDREYLGDFESIRQSINEMANGTYQMIRTMRESTSHLHTGTLQIAESAVHLSTGADMQAQAVNALVDSVRGIDVSVQANTESTMKARNIVDQGQTNALEGERRMQQLTKVVNEVEAYSTQMQAIMQTMNDIVFQTNLLSLNASVEAARAGVHGRGFAVVAEMVRNLSITSKQSADETSNLIEQSLQKIKESVTYANDANTAFGTLVTDIGKVTELIVNISDASQKQVHNVQNIRQNVENIYNVSQSNAAMSEQLAAATEELTSQNDVLNKVIEKYSI